MARPSASARIEGIEKHREQVISQSWAQDLSRDEARRHLSDVPARRFPAVAYAQKGHAPLIQPRGGFPLFEEQQQLTNLLDEAGADFIPLTVDSYTRHNRYDVATQLLTVRGILVLGFPPSLCRAGASVGPSLCWRQPGRREET